MSKVWPKHFAYDFNTTLHFYHASLTQARAKGGEDEAAKVRKRLGETDLFFLLINILNRKDICRAWLFDRCREVQKDPDDHLDLWAREHYKSTIITFGLTIFDIINNPDITVGIFSFSKAIARAFLKQIKTEFEQNEDLPRLWPDIFYVEPQKASPRWSIDDGIVVKRTTNPKEATIEGHGLIEGMPTSKHFGLMVYDDVVTLEGINTPELIQKTTTAFQMSDNLGSEGGRKRYIGTRYHLFDTYSVMIEAGIAIPRIRAATEDGTLYGKPVLLSQETIDKKRQTQGIYVFSSQQLLNPVADTAMGFQLPWVQRGDTDYNGAMASLWRYIIVDPAGGKQRKNNDYTTFWVLGRGADGLDRVLDIRRDRMSLTTRCDTLMELHKLWKPGVVGWEEYGMQADIEHIKFVMKLKLYEFEITPLGGAMNKNLRILRLVPQFENGYKSVQDGGDGVAKSRIILPTTCLRKDHLGQMRDLVKDFIEQEYVAFPVLKHDDMLDGLSRKIDLEQMGLIQQPSATPAQVRGTKVEEGLRKLGRGQGSTEPWVTA